jgi:tRNA dimethylallyltransferase
MEPIINNNNKIIFLLGPTGIGKTFVSLEIANELKGEIINTDAFSLYKEANIMTAKATLNEREKVKHRMIDIIDLFNDKYNLKYFKFDAEKEIENVFKDNKIPIIVGGTNYYVDSLLFNKENLSDEKKNENENINLNKFNNIIDEIIKIKLEESDKDKLYTLINNYLQKFSNDNDILYSFLNEIDEEYANFYHKNDIRRIINAISFFFAYDKRKSESDKEKNYTLKYPNIKLIILFSENFEELTKRIKGRIDEMIFEGGLSEIMFIFHKFKLNNKQLTFTSGILQAIGYKEFFPLYENISESLINNNYNSYNLNNSNHLSQILINEINSNEKLKDIYNKCKNDLIINTINYAKYQIKYIKNKILPLINGYKIINISEFKKEIYKNIYLKEALEYINSDEYIKIENTKNSKLNIWKKYYCEICNCEMNGNKEYENHFKSNKHKKRKYKANKKIITENESK